MRLMSAAAAIALAFGSLALPAAARDQYVTDGAGMFKASTVASLNQSIGDFSRTTGKEVVVVTVPSLDGATAQEAAERVFAQQQVNGVLIFLAKAEKKDGILPDRAAAAFFPAGTLTTIRDAMRGYFREGDYDAGITTGVNLVIDQYRSHERALPASVRQTSYAAPSTSSLGGGMSLFWIILILIAGFLIIRGIFRAIAGPRMMPPGYGGPGPGMGMGGGYGYGGGGYGGGGGGGFFSGLLGGLGGAFIGNELFNRNNGGGEGFNSSGVVGNDGGQQDASGWQSDAGQADPGNGSFGDFGSSGGGFGGGDGGGFGGDGGGGYGDGGGGYGGGW